MCASFGVLKTASAMKVNAWVRAPATDRDLDSWFQYEYKCQDPKDGELCLRRATSGETLVENRSDIDVQIVRCPSVLGRQTNRTIS